jgi:hypothetical protein
MKYRSKIIANDIEGLQIIAAYCAGAEVLVSDIKYLQSNKVFLISLERFKVESKNEDKKSNSILKFAFIENVKSKNIRQDNPDQKLELLSMDYLKNKDNYEINLIFANNAHIALSSEIIDVCLEDQEKID